MSKNDKLSEEFVYDSDEEHPKKKQIINSKVQKSVSNQWQLTGKKKIVINEFKGKPLIHIREYYEDKATGEEKPGKKGIALSKEDFLILKSVMNEVEKLL